MEKRDRWRRKWEPKPRLTSPVAPATGPRDQVWLVEILLYASPAA